MKKYSLSLLLFFCATVLFAQKVTFQPASFTAEDKVTVTIDVTGTPMDGKEPAYLWSWCQKNGSFTANSKTNGSAWQNSSEDNKFTKIAKNVWSISFKPTEFYGVQPSELDEIGIIAKTKDGSAQTSNAYGKIDPLVYTPAVFKIFPANFTENDIVTIIYNQNLEKNADAKTVKEVYVYTACNIKRADGSSAEWQYQKADWGDVGNTNALKFVSQGNGIYTLTLSPRQFYAVKATEKITSLNLVFRNKDGSIKLTCPDASGNNCDKFAVPVE